jgi:hypothetical protein
MAYIPRKDLVRTVENRLDMVKKEMKERGNLQAATEILIDAVEALLALVENDAK